MRNSSRLAATRLPFDVVFIIDRFINVVGAGITQAGGVANHFTGDGLMATFGLNCGAGQACRQAVHALGLIGRNVAALNRVLAADMAETIAFGVGVHGSNAVVGEVGYAQSRVFTTLGDAANVAARLESACKDFGCEAVVSQTVLDLSLYPQVLFHRHDLTVRGRDASLVVHTIDRIEVLHDVPHVTDSPLSEPYRVPRMGTAH
jgi:adenylate cyclase